jgi:hypothetical protein
LQTTQERFQNKNKENISNDFLKKKIADVPFSKKAQKSPILT